ASKLTPEQQAILRNEVLVARGSMREASYAPVIEKMAEEHFEQLKKSGQIAAEDLKLVHQQSFEWARARIQNVAPGGYQPWMIDLGYFKERLRDQPLYLRVKFNAAETSPSGTFTTLWQVGAPDNPLVWQDE